MTDLYQPDGPAATKVKNVIPDAATPYLRAVCMALAHEIDKLREIIDAQGERITQMSEDHLDDWHRQ